MLEDATRKEDLGEDFGATLTAVEVEWLMDHEFTLTAEDVLWRRTKLGLRMGDAEAEWLELFTVKQREKRADTHLKHAPKKL
jgi:glycerol-3-phosphate dehydrogenase